MSIKNKEKYEFKKGQKLHLDEIYFIQGLGGGVWWEHINEDTDNDVIIIMDITIEITITKKIITKAC